jgi:hydrogenase expression/formation protein HypD
MSMNTATGFRSAELTHQLAKKIHGIYHSAVAHHGNLRRQTHAILQYGLDQLLPPEITLIHGPWVPGMRHFP